MACAKGERAVTRAAYGEATCWYCSHLPCRNKVLSLLLSKTSLIKDVLPLPAGAALPNRHVGDGLAKAYLINAYTM